MRFLCYVTRQQYPESSLSRREEENLNPPDDQVTKGDLLNRSPHSHLPTVSSQARLTPTERQLTRTAPSHDLSREREPPAQS